MTHDEQIRLAIARRLRAAREQAGLSQGQVARMLGFNRPTISELEAGRRRVSGEELSTFSKTYGVSISWLTTEKPEVADPKVELAARELSKLKHEDLDTVLQLLRTLRKSEGKTKNG